MKGKFTVILSVCLAFLLAGSMMLKPDILNTELFTDAAYAANEENEADETDSADENVISVDLGTVEGSTYEITEKGTYSLSGEFAGQIRIDAGEENKVKLILAGVTLTNENDAAVYCVSADKLVIAAAEGTENSISVSGEYAKADDNNVDGAVFAKTDLTFNGTGVLNIVSESGHGIVSKDTLKLKSGTVNVISGGKGLSGKDEIEISGGTLSVIADDDALNSGGDIEIEGGALNLSSGDDGIHADGELEISNGSVYVKESYEGLEALFITIEGGHVEITATDDGVNTAGGNDESGTFGRFGGGDPFQTTEGAGVLISGGTVIIDTQADGIDSNGSIEVTGGELYISGPENGGNGAIDYASSATISGGIVVAAGSSEMAEGFGSGSAQGSILYNFDSTYDGGSSVALEDSEGNVLASFTPSRSFSSVVVSAPGLESSGTYRLHTGGDEYEIEMSGSTSWSNGGLGMGGQPGGGFGGGIQGMQGGPGGFGGGRDPGAMGGQPGDFGGGMQGGQAPEMNAAIDSEMNEDMQSDQNGQTSEMNGNAQPGQLPKMNGNMQPGQGGQPPEMNGGMQNGQNMNSPEPPEMTESGDSMTVITETLDRLLEENVITQEIYDSLIDSLTAAFTLSEAPEQE